MNRFPTIWAALDIAATTDPREIRRAYARRLKVMHPEDEPEAFQQLRAAYEHAMQLATQAAAQDAQAGHAAQTEHAARAEPDAPAPAPPAAPEPAQPVPVDEDMRVASELFAELEQMTRADRPTLTVPERDALQRLLSSPALGRLDLLQRVEIGLASMLVDRIPRTDHLLLQAARFFEWDKRAHEGSLPPPARQVLARLTDLEFLEAVNQRQDEASKAYRRLMAPQQPIKRWLSAHSKKAPAEIHVLQLLGGRHPALFNQVPAETVEWWRRFADRPRPSIDVAVTGMILTIGMFVVAMLGNSGEPDGPERSLFAAACVFASTIIAVVFKQFAIDWPRLLIWRKWHGPPPWQPALAWFPVCALGVAGAQVFRDVAPVAWACAALSGLGFLWAMQVAGHPPRVDLSREVLGSRPVQITLLNAMFFGFVMTVGGTDGFDPAWVVAMICALLASGFGRDSIARVYYQSLTVRSRLVALGVFGALVLAFTASIFAFGGHVAYLPWIVWGTLALTMARRALPHSVLFHGNVYAMLGIILAGAVAASTTVMAFGVDGVLDDGRRLIPAFAVFFMYGAIGTIALELHRMKELRDRGQLT